MLKELVQEKIFSTLFFFQLSGKLLITFFFKSVNLVSPGLSVADQCFTATQNSAQNNSFILHNQLFILKFLF
jgi:hypothetical protein